MISDVGSDRRVTSGLAVHQRDALLEIFRRMTVVVGGPLEVRRPIGQLDRADEVGRAADVDGGLRW